MADPPAELLGPKPFKMGLLSRLLANSSFSTKAFEKNHPPHPPHPPDYSLPRSAELKLSALKKIKDDFCLETRTWLIGLKILWR